MHANKQIHKYLTQFHHFIRRRSRNPRSAVWYPSAQRALHQMPQMGAHQHRQGVSTVQHVDERCEIVGGRTDTGSELVGTANVGRWFGIEEAARQYFRHAQTQFDRSRR